MHLPWSTLNEDPTSTGCAFPTHQTMGPHYNYDGDRSVYKIPSNQLAPFEPDFNDVVFESTAIHLDLIASAPIPHYGWIISDKFTQLLGDFTLPPHRTYRLPVLQDAKPISGYSWIHLPQPRMEITETASIGEAEKLIASKPELAELDVLPIYSPIRFGYFFVSARLRRAIETAALSGIRFGTSKLFRTGP